MSACTAVTSPSLYRTMVHLGPGRVVATLPEVDVAIERSAMVKAWDSRLKTPNPVEELL